MVTNGMKKLTLDETIFLANFDSTFDSTNSLDGQLAAIVTQL
jgi:hypothetical protein